MPETSALPVTERTHHRRLREQGSTDRADLEEILRAGVICHLGVVVDGYPMVVPTAYGVDGETVCLHGSVASRSLVAAPDATVCVTVTHLDGLVLARSVFEHALPVWAGVLPLTAAWQKPDPDPVLPPGIPVPPHIAALVGRQAGQ